MHKHDDTTLPLLEQALMHLPEPLLLVEAGTGEPGREQGRTVFANEAACVLSGYRQEELVGESPAVLWSRDNGANAPEALARALNEQAAFSGEAALFTKAGKELATEVQLRPLPELGQARHFLLSVHDIRDRKHELETRKQLQEQLFQSQKFETIGVLASGIAHDFNNILTGIVGSTELLKMTLPVPHPAHEDLDNIMQATQRAAALTRELLTYASTGQHGRELIKLNQMVTSILVILRSQMSRSIIVRKALMPDVPNVEADAVQIQQVMMNLCLNASEAMKEQGGILSITTDRVTLDEKDCDACTYLRPQPGEYAVFEVTDTGAGMDNEKLRRLFEPFFTSKTRARGLGLAVVHSIVKAHHGGIQVTSELGQGTTVRIFLPASSKDLPERAVGTTSGVSGKHTILLVDDEEVLRSLGQRALEHFGYRVLLAADGIEAVRVFREHAAEIDLVILDLSMPRKGGEDAYQEMRTVRDDLKILLCCGYNEALASSKLAGEHIVGFLPKPYGIDTLAQTVQTALQGKSSPS